jgi:hypothetical protein
MEGNPMKRSLMAACAMAAATAAVAGMYDQPYAIVETGDRSDVREEFPAAITRIDGKSTRNSRRSDPIEPGKRMVTVRFETSRVAQAPSEASREVSMELEGCTRYRIVAKRVDGTNWEPRVYSEPISECVRKFKKG